MIVGRQIPDKTGSLSDSDDCNRTFLQYLRHRCILRRDSFSESKTLDDASKEIGRRLNHTASITTAPPNQMRPRRSQNPPMASAAGADAWCPGRSFNTLAEITSFGCGEGKRPLTYAPRAEKSAAGTANFAAAISQTVCRAAALRFCKQSTTRQTTIAKVVDSRRCSSRKEIIFSSPSLPVLFRLP